MLSRLWTFLVFFCFFARIGEAAVPGPATSDLSDIADPSWFHASPPGFCIGIGNPSGISNKLHVLESFPIGWWHLAETQASKFQQCCLQRRLQCISKNQNRCIRSVLGAPAPLRAGSSEAGSWTGVLSFGDCPLREVPVVLNNGEYSNGRVSFSTAHLSGFEISAATVYLPPRGPSYPNARHLSELLLQRVSEEIVFGRQGPRIILGDFNCEAGSLDAMKLWGAQGFVEVQSWFASMFGFQPRKTCKGATAPDQIWVSADILPLLTNIGTWRIFPDHDVLMIGLSLPRCSPFERQWPLPARIPWDHVDFDLWASQAPLQSIRSRFLEHQRALDFPPSHAQSKDSISKAFASWSRDFESQVSRSLCTDVASHDSSFKGRAKLVQPKLRRVQPAVPRHARPGEETQASGFLNRSLNRWYKQLRRLQSYKHSICSSRVAETFEARAPLWQCILRAPGFVGGFQKWWPSRCVRLQGSPLALPDYPPGVDLALEIYDDFLANYRRYEHWQCTKRRLSLQAKVESSSKDLFAITRKPPKPVLDCLEDTVSQAITVVDTCQNHVMVPQPFPEASVHAWTLQDQPAVVRRVGQAYQVECDLLLCSGQTLSCHQTISETSHIQEKLAQLWSPYWNRHSEVSDDRWAEIVDFGVRFLPSGVFSLPAVTRSDWHKAIHKFKLSAAAGPCGWARSDLHNLLPSHVDDILELFEMIEAGVPWPTQCSTGLIHCLQKKADRFSVEGFRPITITSMLFRVYAGIRAGQLLHQISQLTDQFQCGFSRKRKSSDVWYFVNLCVELALQQTEPIHGYVADLIKAYNTLPRSPIFKILQHCGVPSWFITLWKNYLVDFQRFFVVRRCTSPVLFSSTGFPEGCPLSCVAMSCIDWLWHIWQHQKVPRTLAISYVDNLECLAHDIDHLHLSWTSLMDFCSALDLFVDRRQLYAWSTTAAGRRELKSLGYRISLGERDLGGQVCYTASLRNKVLTDRMASVHPFFDVLRRSSVSIHIKKTNIRQVLWPRAFHGCEAVTVGSQHLNALRTGVMKALRWNRAGASPLARVALLHTEDLDPGWQDLWLSIKLFRQQCLSLEILQDWWGKYVESETSTHGPFGKLWELFSGLELVLDKHFRLWFTDRAWIHFLYAPLVEVQAVCIHGFWKQQSALLSKRAGFDDLRGFDYKLTTSCDHTIGGSELELLNIVRDGTFFTDVFRSKFDVSRKNVCPICGQQDTREHRYRWCPHYDEVRSHHTEILQKWSSLPSCFRQFGLVGENPWRTLLWEAFISLPCLLTEWSCKPSGKVINVFTDRSCISPHEQEEALASWAAVWVEGNIIISSGPLRGMTQTILRAEISAVLSAIKWIQGFDSELHIWCDNQTTVDHFRALQQNLAGHQDFEHADLWCEIELTLQKLTSEVYIHKVASHMSEDLCFSPQDDWCRYWNGVADSQANQAQGSRPPWFQRVWDKYQSYRSDWKRNVRQLSAFHLAVAQKDIQVQEQQQFCEEISVEDIAFERFENDFALSGQLFLLQDSEFVFDPQSDSAKFPFCTNTLIAWLIHTDQEAASVRLVSFLELFVCFRLSCGKGRTLRQIDGIDTVFTEASFASDFRHFRRLIFSLLKAAGMSVGDGFANLSSISIFMPLPGIYLGWTTESEVQSLEALRAFVGHRPIRSAQALSKPWRC